MSRQLYRVTAHPKYLMFHAHCLEQTCGLSWRDDVIAAGRLNVLRSAVRRHAQQTGHTVSVEIHQQATIVPLLKGLVP